MRVDFYQWITETHDNSQHDTFIFGSTSNGAANGRVTLPTAKAAVYQSLMKKGDLESAKDVYQNGKANQDYSYNFAGDQNHIFGDDDEVLGRKKVRGGAQIGNGKPKTQIGNTEKTKIDPGATGEFIRKLPGIKNYASSVYASNMKK